MKIDYMNVIKKIISLLKQNYIFYTDDIEKDIIKKIQHDKNIQNYDEPEIAGFLYVILQKYDNHFSFQPRLKNKKIKMDKEYFNKLFKTKIIGNIGIIKFNEFPDFGLTKQYSQKSINDLSLTNKKLLCNSTINAIEKVINCKNIIFDLSDNGGGCDQVALFLMSFIFDKKTTVNVNIFKNEKRKEQTFTKKELEKICNCNNLPLLYDKKIFVYISKNTFSAAEFFAFTLQKFKKAKIIGIEKSMGGCNGGDFYTVNKNMKMFIPYFYPKFSWTNGIIPNIKNNIKEFIQSNKDN